MDIKDLIYTFNRNLLKIIMNIPITIDAIKGPRIIRITPLNLISLFIKGKTTTNPNPFAAAVVPAAAFSPYSGISIRSQILYLMQVLYLPF